MALGRARPGQSAILVAVAVHYLLITSVLPALHVCELHAHAEPCAPDTGRDDVLTVREHPSSPAGDHDHEDCVACQFKQLPKTFPAQAAFRTPMVSLRDWTLVARDDLPSSFRLLACVLPRGPPAHARA